MAAVTNVVDFVSYRAARKARETTMAHTQAPVAMVPVAWVPMWFFYCHQPAQEAMADGRA
jgi:hypothetical protein